MSIALNIIEIAGSYAAESQAERVNEIELEIGALAGVDTEALLKAFDIAKKGTLMAASTIHVATIAPKAVCATCQKEFEFTDFFYTCPECDGVNIEITAGNELKIKSLNVD